MIFVDANVLLRYFVKVGDAHIKAQERAAHELIQAVESGDESISTTVVAIHEIAYFLSAKSHFGFAVAEVSAVLSSFLRLPGVKLPSGEKQRYLNALELWETYPVLGFADALLATITLENEGELATFDGDFDRVPGLRRWQPAATA